MISALRHKLAAYFENRLYAVGMKRAAEIVNPLLPWLRKRDGSIMDFGCGLGHVGSLVAQATGRKVTGLDVRRFPFISPGFEVVVFDGGVIPYPDCHFDTTLIALVLHHTPNPARSLKEALRVTDHSMIICEDLLVSRSEIRREIIKDSIANGFAPHMTLQYHTEKEWEEMFASSGLTIQAKIYLNSKFIFRFHHVAWWLIRNPSDRPAHPL